MSKFKIYTSSAGSGKTYTLVKEYLHIAFLNSQNYTNIIAITFTNKAAQEMKERILEQLQYQTTGKENALSIELCNILDISNTQLIFLSKELLKNIIHNYSKFKVCTIDSFFQNIVNSFAKEIGLDTGFEIETDLQYVSKKVVDNLITNLYDNEKLIESLTQLAKDKLSSGKNWNFKNELLLITKEIFNEHFIQNSENLIEFIEKKTFYTNYVKYINIKISSFENKLKYLATKALSLIEDNLLKTTDFAYGDKGVAGFFKHIKRGTKFEFPNRAKNALEDIDKWYSKNSPKKHIIAKLVTDCLQNILKKIHIIFQIEGTEYHTCKSIKSLIYTLSVIGNILNEINIYRKKNNVIFISDTQFFLNKIIKDTDTPFLYEKIGEKYKYFLIDEFQDVSKIQWYNLKPLIENLLAEGGECIVVGDPKQSIYRWRGGDPTLLSQTIIEQFSKFNIQIKHLENNWRSCKEVINFNNNFFLNASNIIYKTLKDEITDVKNKTIKKELMSELNSIYNCYKHVEQSIPKKNNSLSGRVTVLHFDNIEEILNKTMQDIDILLNSKYTENEIAILTRDNKEAKLISEFIIKKNQAKKLNFRYNININSSLLLDNQPEIRIIICAIKFILNKKDKISFFELFNTYDRYIKSNTFDKIYNENKNQYIIDKLTILKKNFFNYNVYETAQKIIKIFDLKNQDSIIYLNKFFDLLINFKNKENNTIYSFILWWEEVGCKQTFEPIANNNAINIMTIHQSKGLQYRAIFIPFCHWQLDHPNQKAPIIWCKNKEKNIPIPLLYSKHLKKTYHLKEYLEEKIKIYFDNLNLLYVGFTRSKEILNIFYKKEKISKEINKISNLLIDYTK